MTIYQRTRPGIERTRLRTTRRGLVAEYQRPKVGGGYFTEVSVSIQWPWRKYS